MNFLGLPTHLPNAAVLAASEIPDSKQSKQPIPEVASTPHRGDDDEEETVHHSPGTVVYIPGTTISLQTDEDIAKWIEERRRKWPTKRNIQQKEQDKINDISNRLNKRQLPQAESQSTQPAKRSRTDQGSNAESNAESNPGSNPGSNAESTGAQSTKGSSNGGRKQICKFYEKNKRCRYGTKCRNIHESANSSTNNSTNNSTTAHSNGSDERPHSIQAFPVMKIPRNCVVRSVNGIKVLVPQRYKGTNVSSSLFANLVQQDQHQFENSLVLEFIQLLESHHLINHDVGKS